MNFRYFLLLALMFSFTSCGTEESAATSKADLLEGHWELQEAFRSGKKTESLGGTYFTFTKDKMSTNLPIQGAIDSPYSRKDKIITQTIINDLTIDYNIESLTDDQLKLNTKLRNLDFSFILQKKK